MKRMIADSLITWVKSLFHRIAPGTGEADIQIGGNLEVDGYLSPNALKINNNQVNINSDEGQIVGHFESYVATETDFAISSYDDDSGLIVDGGRIDVGIFDGSLDAFLYGFRIYNNNIEVAGNTTFNDGKITLGETALTEVQLQKLLALIPAE